MLKEKKYLYGCQEENSITVEDQGDFRILSFKEVIQSKIQRQHPYLLALRYTQYMIGLSLMAIPTPRRILLIGIGAGAILHFLQHFYPHSEIDAVDSSTTIIDIATTYFHLHRSEHLRIHCDDGLHFLLLQTSSTRYDLILVDAFTDTGMARTIYSELFFRNATGHLTAQGIITSNLWTGNRDAYRRAHKAIIKAATSTMFVPVRRRENMVSLLFQNRTPWKNFLLKKQELLGLQERFHFDFSEISQAAAHNNLCLAQRLQRLFH